MQITRFTAFNQALEPWLMMRQQESQMQEVVATALVALCYP